MHDPSRSEPHRTCRVSDPACVRLTPIVETSGSDFGLEPCRLTFKLELLQHASSFKTRGAFANLLLRISPWAPAWWRLREITAPLWRTRRNVSVCARRYMFQPSRHPQDRADSQLRRRAGHRRRDLRGRSL